MTLRNISIKLVQTKCWGKGAQLWKGGVLGSPPCPSNTRPLPVLATAAGSEEGSAGGVHTEQQQVLLSSSAKIPVVLTVVGMQSSLFAPFIILHV